MSESVQTMVDRWARASGNTQNFLATYELLRLLASELYSEYQPFPESPPFLDRLRQWLNNVPDGEDRKHLFEFVPWLLFIGRREMEVMYRSAFTGPISRWIIDHANLDFSDSDFSKRFQAEADRTFFGSIAGMDIGSFVRVNGLRGQSLRPDFRVLSKLGDIQAIRNHLHDHDFARVVAVEDYVGTGDQMKQAVAGLSQLAPSEVLLCPIVVAPIGATEGERLAANSSHLSFAPLFVVPPSATLPENIPIGGSDPTELSRMRSIAIRLYAQVQGSVPDPQLDGPFGFGSTGSLVMTYFNCPDNVPPLVHHLSDTWMPLFRRLYREA